MRNLTIPKTAAFQSLHSFLKKQFPKSYVEKLFRKDGVRINGKRGKKETILHSGEILTFYVPLQQGSSRPEMISSWKPDVLFEDEDILILNKKAGMAAHEGKTIGLKESLLGHLQSYYKEKGVTPYLVHRLDRDTSGCLLIVKKESLIPHFEHMFEEGRVQKEYLTLVQGSVHPKKGTISFPLPGRDDNLVPAITLYEVKKVFADAQVSLVTVQIKTGRMHQIRLHFAQIGHPIVMDDEHGDFTFNKIFRKTYGLKRQFLHAKKLSFPYNGQQKTVEAPLPADLQHVLEKLE